MHIFIKSGNTNLNVLTGKYIKINSLGGAKSMKFFWIFKINFPKNKDITQFNQSWGRDTFSLVATHVSKYWLGTLWPFQILCLWKE